MIAMRTYSCKKVKGPERKNKCRFAIPMKCARGISIGKRTLNTRFQGKLGMDSVIFFKQTICLLEKKCSAAGHQIL
jgi:hypothetical protein